MNSDRLKFSEIKTADSEVLHEILSNPDHMKHTIQTTTFAESENYFGVLEGQWQKYGFGAWCVKLTGSNQIIGWGGIIIDEEEPEWGPELVYFLHPQATGRGYAFELGKQAIHYAFEIANLEKICAFAKKENTASCRLIQKLGFTYCRYVHELSRNYYEIQSSS